MIVACNECKLLLEEDMFWKSKYKKNGLNSICKKCWSKKRKEKIINDKHWAQKQRDKTKKWKLNNPQKTKEMMRKHCLKRRYKITVDYYNKMLDKQKYSCAICNGINKNGNKLSVDHDHKTGKVRELLCQSCNTILGRVDDNIDILIKLIEYLKKHRR